MVDNQNKEFNILKDLVNTEEFYKNVLTNYLLKIKEYADKYSLIEYLNNMTIYKDGYYYDSNFNKFTLIELQNNRYLFISNFYTCIYDADTHKTLDLNQAVKEKYDLKSDVYLSTTNNILSILNSNSDERVINKFNSDDKDNYLASTHNCAKDTYTSGYFLNYLLDTRKKIHEQNKKDTWEDYLTFLTDRYGGTKKDYNSMNTFLNKLPEEIKIEVYKLQDKPDLKDTYIPFSFFNIIDDNSFECAYILIDVDQGKIIFPNKENIIDLFKNQLLIDDSQIVKSNYIDETFDFKNHKGSKFRRDILMDLQDKTDVKEMMQLTTKKIFSNHKDIHNIKNADKFAYTNPLYYTHFITPVIYGKTEYPLYNIAKTITPYKRLKNNIFSIKYNESLIKNTLYETRDYCFTEFINTAFIMNKNNILQYKTNLVLPIDSYDTNTIKTVFNNLSTKVEYIPEFDDTIFKVKKNKKVNNIDNLNYIILGKDSFDIDKIRSLVSLKLLELSKETNYIPEEMIL